jgi:hypothetical protein
VAAAPAKSPHLQGNDLLSYILGEAKAKGGDPQAVASVAYAEGGYYGAVGDSGTSFGPFQLHVGGALPPSVVDNPATPQDERAIWANSPVGVSYGVGRAVSVSKGKSGSDAIAAMISGFERPADYGQGVAAGLSPDAAARQTRDYKVASGVYGTFKEPAPGSTAAILKRIYTDPPLTPMDPARGGFDPKTGKETTTNPPHFTGVLGTVQSFADFVAWFGNPRNYVRIGEVILGGILLILGLLMVGRASLASAGNPQRQLAGAVRAVR